MSQIQFQCLREAVNAARIYQLQTVAALKFHLQKSYSDKDIYVALKTWGARLQ